MKPAVSFAAVFAVHLIAAQAAEGTDVLVHSRASGFGVEYLQAVRALPSHARTARKLARCRAEVFSDSNVSFVTLNVTGAVRIARAGLREIRQRTALHAVHMEGPQVIGGIHRNSIGVIDG